MVTAEATTSISSLIGLAGCGLLFVNAIMAAARSRRYAVRGRMMLFLVTSAVAFWPVNGLSVAGYLRGVTGDVSVTTLTLLVAASISRLCDVEVYDPRSFFVLMLVVIGGGLFVYPSALGVTYLDAYALGYGSKTFVAMLFLVSLAAWHYELYLVVLCVCLGVLAYLMGMYESRNLWDYVIDPLITVYAVFWLLMKEIKHVCQASSAGTRYSLTRKGGVG
jgi:hypothetical protein